MRKSITISLTILSVVAVISILLASSQVVEIPDTNKVPSRKTIVRTIASDLTNYGINFKDRELVVKKYLYQDNWIVAKVLSLDEPIDSESRLMIYILKEDNDKLSLVAFSGDGFNDSSSEIPEDVVKKAESL